LFWGSRAVIASRERDGVNDAVSGCSPAGGRVIFSGKKYPALSRAMQFQKSTL
jgi:hypothetical protein